MDDRIQWDPEIAEQLLQDLRSAERVFSQETDDISYVIRHLDSIANGNRTADALSDRTRRYYRKMDQILETMQELRRKLLQINDRFSSTDQELMNRIDELPSARDQQPVSNTVAPKQEERFVFLEDFLRWILQSPLWQPKPYRPSTPGIIISPELVFNLTALPSALSRFGRYHV